MVKYDHVLQCNEDLQCDSKTISYIYLFILLLYMKHLIYFAYCFFRPSKNMLACQQACVNNTGGGGLGVQTCQPYLDNT